MQTAQIALITIVALLNGVALLWLSLGIQKLSSISNPGGVKNETYE